MKLCRFLFPLFALALCALGPPAFAAGTKNGTITSTQCVSIDVTDQGTVGIYVGGTWTGTLQPEISIQGQAGQNIQVTPTTSPTPQSTITADGAYQAKVAGGTTFLLCGATVGSGTANVYLNATVTSSSGGFGGGGGGSVTGTGTLNYITKWTGTTVIGNSVGVDNGVAPTDWPLGLDMNLHGALANEFPNNSPTGTVINKLACDDGTGAVLICPHATSVTNQPIGTVTAHPGTTGAATVSFIGLVLVCFDNQSVAEDYAIESSSSDGCLHDTGSTTQTPGQPNFFVWTANAGANTNGYYRLLTANDFAAFAGGGITGSGTQYTVSEFTGLHTIGNSQIVDDLVHPILSPNGVNVSTNGNYNVAVPNDPSTGTIPQTAACNNGSQQAITCPSVSSLTNVPIGFTGAGTGTTGNVTICALGFCPVLMDNSALAGDYAIGSPITDGYLHDNGSVIVGGQANFYIWASNSGPGTAAIISRLNPNDFIAGGGGFANPMTTLGDLIDGGASGIANRLAGPTSPNSVPQYLCSVPSGGLATLPAWCLQGVPLNPQSGTTYTVLPTDRTLEVDFNNASPVAVTLPQAGTAGYDSNFVFTACDIGAGTATITPTVSTISYTTGSSYTSAASSLALTTGQCATIESGDNINYNARTITSIAGAVSSWTGDGVLFDNSASTGAVTAHQQNATAGTVFGNATGSAAAPGFTAAPVLGVDNTTAGTLQLANGSATAHTIFASGATTTNTIKTFAAVPVTGDLIDCIVASTTCTMTDSGVLASHVVVATSPGLGYAHFAGSTQALTSVTIPRAISFSIYNSAGLTSGTGSANYALVTIPFGCTISAYNLLIDGGTITVKFWKIATGTAIPTVSNSISSSGVGISSGTAIHSTTVSDFTTLTVSANDIMAMDITAVSGASLVNGVLQCDESQ